MSSEEKIYKMVPFAVAFALAVAVVVAVFIFSPILSSNRHTQGVD